MTPDVNVLIAASREEHVHHLKARDWLLEACAQSAATRAGAGQPGRALRQIPYVMASFMRLVTNARVFATPTHPHQTIAFLDALLDCPAL